MADRVKCPQCGVSVKVENLPSHYERLHPKAKVPQKLLEKSEEATKVAKEEKKERMAGAAVTITPGGKRLIAVVAVIIAIVLVIIIVNPFRPPGPQVGDVAPDFTVPNADGSGAVIRLSTYIRGYVALLELMDVNCGVCQEEAPILAQVYGNATIQARNVKFLSVSLIDWVPPADTTSTISDFKISKGTTWTYGMDSNHAVRDLYFPGSTGFGTPATYLLDRNGKIAYILKGHQPGGAGDYIRDLLTVLGG